MEGAKSVKASKGGGEIWWFGAHMCATGVSKEYVRGARPLNRGGHIPARSVTIIPYYLHHMIKKFKNLKHIFYLSV